MTASVSETTIDVPELLKIHTVVLGDDWTPGVPGYDFQAPSDKTYERWSVREDGFISWGIGYNSSSPWSNLRGDCRRPTKWQYRALDDLTIEIRRDLATLSLAEANAVFEYFRRLPS